MKAADFPGWLRDTVLRMFPHATRPGLRAIGRPGPSAPVLVTGNYALTVRRLCDAMAGRDAWLLVANSRGINVWCAAGGGHLTDHDVIAVVRASGVGERVTHRTLILPQLAATGVERRRIAESTGWKVKWGPARLEDIPAFLDHGARVSKAQRWMRFPAWERLEMASIWALPMASISALILWLAVSLAVAAVTAGVILTAVAAMFLGLPWLRVTGRRRWLTYGAFTAAGIVTGAGVLAALGLASPAALAGLAVTCTVAMGILSVDFTGTTPWYPGTVNSFGNRFDIDLVEDRCTGAAQCVQVCPRDVLVMNGKRRKVELARPDDCVRCGACIVQCPEDALRFRFADGRIVPPSTVRETRVNLLGRRTVSLDRSDKP